MNLFKHTFIYKTYQFIKSIFIYRKDKKLIGDTLYSDEFKLVLKRYLNLNIKKDWLGRLYGVINPLIDIDGKFNVNNMVIELDDNNTNNDQYVKTWIHKQLKLISDLFKIHRLYEYINMDITKLDNIDNYLIVFDIVARKEMSNSFKKFIKHFIFYGIVALAVFLFIL